LRNDQRREEVAWKVENEKKGEKIERREREERWTYQCILTEPNFSFDRTYPAYRGNIVFGGQKTRNRLRKPSADPGAALGLDY